jgi:hypothetical protein
MGSALLLTGGNVPKVLESPMKARKVTRITDIVRKENSMTDKEKKRTINKILTVVRKVLSRTNCIGFDINGEPYIDQPVITSQLRKELEVKL